MKKISIISLIVMGLFASCEAQKNETNSSSEVNGVVAKNINAEEFNKLITSNNGLILDVRTPEEVAEAKIEGSVNINIYDENFVSKINDLDKSKTIYVYCKSGGRSGRAMNEMKNLGFKKIYNLDGGITSWKSEGLPTI